MLRNKRGIAVVTALCGVLGHAGAPASAATPKLVTVIGGLPVVLDVNEPGAAQRIAVGLRQGVKANQLHLRLLFARDAHNRNANLLKRFTVELDPKARPVAINIAVQAKHGEPAVQPGRYRLVLGFRQGGRSQPVALTVVVPAVALRADPPLEVQESKGLLSPSISFLGLGGHAGPQPRLLLDPDSPSLTGIKVQTVSQPIDGTIEFEASKRLSHGEAMTLEPKLAGLSPGTYRGSIEVRADQLARPLTFRYTVRVKRNGWWIVLFVAFGFIAGQIVRKGLVALIGWLQAVRTAYDYAAWLADAAAVAADDDFANELRRTRNTLLQEIRRPTRSETITAALTKAKGSWSAAVVQYEASSTEQTKRLEDLGKDLPADTGIERIDAVIASARDHAEQAAKLLSASDPPGAKRLITQAELLRTKLPATAAAWAGEAYGLLEAAASAPSRDTTSLGELVDGARTALAAIEADGATTAQMLTSANEAIPRLRHVVREVRSDVQALARKALEPGVGVAAGPDGDDGRERLRQNLAEAEAILREERVGEDGVLKKMAALLEALSEELESLSPQQQDLATYGVLGDQPRTVQVTPVPRGSEPPGEARPTHKIPAPATGAAPSVPAFRVNLGSSVNLAALLLVLVIRLIILTVLFSVIGWLAYHEHFVGTTQEMAGIFLWAFTTDLTIEGITQLASKRSQPPPAPAGGTAPTGGS